MNQNQIAEKLGISQSSVSLVLRNPATPRVSEKMKKRIIQCLKASRYMTPAGTIRHWNIGYVTDTFQNVHQLFFQESLRGIEEEAARNHYNLIMECLREKQTHLLMSRKVDGVIVRSGKAYEILQKNNLSVPMVMLNCASPITQCDAVMPDNRSGLHKIIRYLHELDIDHVLFVSCKSEYSPYSCNYRERESSFMEACFYRKMKYSIEYVPEPSSSGAKIRDHIQRLVQQWKKDKPQAVVTVNCYYASLIHLLYPEVLLVAGDNKPENSLNHGDFPMLIQDGAYMGKMATELLLKRIAKPTLQHVRINCDMDLFIPEK